MRSDEDKYMGVWVASELLPTGPLTRDEARSLADDMKGEWPNHPVELDVHPDTMRYDNDNDITST